MDPVTLFLVSLAGIFLVGSIGEAVFKRTNIPDVVWLILMGLFVGPMTHLVEARSLGSIAPYFAALTLIIVLFEGGSRLKIQEVAQEAHRSLLLALLTFSASVLLVFLIALIPISTGLLPGWTWRHGLLLGTILGGSSSIVIMPTLQQAQVRPGVSNLLSLESAFTDIFCVVGTSALLGLFTDPTGSGSPLSALTRSFGLGLFFGLGAGAVWLLALKPLRSINQPYAITLSFLILLYVLVDRTGGSAALAILAYSVVVGNAGWISRKLGLTEPLGMGEDVRDFHSQLAFFIKSFFFTFIGAMLTPPWGYILFGVGLGALLLPARYPGAWMLGRGGKLEAGEKLLVIVALPRGMAAGVLATMPMAAGLAGTENFPVIAFACVFTTILIFAAGFPMALKDRSSQPPPAA